MTCIPNLCLLFLLLVFKMTMMMTTRSFSFVMIPKRTWLSSKSPESSISSISMLMHSFPLSYQHTSFHQYPQLYWGNKRKRSLRRLYSTSTTTQKNIVIQNNSNTFLDQQKDVNTIITYITDVEGDKYYLDRYVEMSKVLQFVETNPNNNNKDDNDNNSFLYDKYIDFTIPNAMLVFGGDIWDKGGFDLYVCRQLLSLKSRYPDRVIFILGNRDINKLRILQEIGLEGHDLPHHPGLLWLKDTGRIGDPTNPDLLPPNSAPERLQWMLGSTMGSPDAFENRRNELAWEMELMNNMDPDTNNFDDVITVTDKEVVESYQRSCHPKGELGRYISQACLAQRLGPLVFVHGSLPLTKEIITEYSKTGGSGSVWDDMAPFMPWLPPEETASRNCNVNTIDDWLDALNEFCHDNVQKWINEIERIESESSSSNCGDGKAKEDSDEGEDQSIWSYRGGYHYGPSYSALIQYGMGMLPIGGKYRINPTVVYNSFTPSGMPDRFIPSDDDMSSKEEEDYYVRCTKEFFDRANVEVILVGHKPQGDLPTGIKIERNSDSSTSSSSSWVLCCDTSYSGDTIWYHHDTDDNDDVDNNKITDTASNNERRSNLGRGNSVSSRGDFAVSEVLLEIEKTTNPSSSQQDTSNDNKMHKLRSVIYHGILSDGTEYGTVNLLDHAHNTTIGQVAPDDLVPSELDSPHNGRWWTKTIFADGSHLFHAGEGFNIWNLLSKPKTKND